MALPVTVAEVKETPKENGQAEPKPVLKLSDIEVRTLQGYHTNLENGKAQLNLLQGALNAMVTNALAARGLKPEDYQLNLESGEIAPKEKK